MKHKLRGFSIPAGARDIFFVAIGITGNAESLAIVGPPPYSPWTNFQIFSVTIKQSYFYFAFNFNSPLVSRSFSLLIGGIEVIFCDLRNFVYSSDQALSIKQIVLLLTKFCLTNSDSIAFLSRADGTFRAILFFAKLKFFFEFIHHHLRSQKVQFMKLEK